MSTNNSKWRQKKKKKGVKISHKPHFLAAKKICTSEVQHAGYTLNGMKRIARNCSPTHWPISLCLGSVSTTHSLRLRLRLSGTTTTTTTTLPPFWVPLMTYPYFSPITFFLIRFLSSLSTSLLSSPVKGRKGISHPTLPLVCSVVYYVLPRHTRVVSLIRGEAHQARTQDIIRTNSFIVLYYCNHKHELIINVM